MSKARPVIAVVDDEEQMRKALCRLLTIHGYEVADYARSEDLLTDLPQRRLDCLVLDLHMSGCNGFEVLRIFGERQVTLPVVVITGHDKPGTEALVRSLGASAYLLKPVDESTLVTAIQRALSS
jgi:FixJ family two-component response regulator